MPLNETEFARVRDLIQEVAEKDYLEDFLDIYGTTISIAETHPEQVNNEIRNTLTHIARAYKAESVHDAAEDIKAARSHIERAKRDCLKLSIITKRDQIQSAIFRIEITEGAVPRSIKTKLRSIENQRKDIFKSESNGHQVTTALEEILVDSLELEEQLLLQYPDPGTVIPKAKRYWHKTVRFAANASLTIVLGLITSIIVLLFLPDDSEYVQNGRELVADFFSSSTKAQAGVIPAPTQNPK